MSPKRVKVHCVVVGRFIPLKYSTSIRLGVVNDPEGKMKETIRAASEKFEEVNTHQLSSAL